MADRRVHHITYASLKFTVSAWVLAHSARRYGLSTRIYTPRSPVARELRQQYPEIMRQPRGVGYWLWKPYIIRDAMQNAADGDLVLYTDSAVVFAADPAPLFAVAREHPIVLFEQAARTPERIWTKRDCFVLLDADTAAYWETPQLAATCQLYRVGPEARAFIDELCRVMANANVLTDLPNVCGLPNLPGYREHRHDQSVLTIQAVKYGLPRFRDPTQFGAMSPAGGADAAAPPLGTVFNHHRSSSGKVLQAYWRFRRAERAGARRN